MRKILILACLVLSSITVPALAQDGVPDLVGNWTGVIHVVKWTKNTDSTYSGEPTFRDGNTSLLIEEQNVQRFAGTLNHREMILGVIGSDNQTLYLVDEDSYYSGRLISSDEMEIYTQEVDLEGMRVGVLNLVRQ